MGESAESLMKLSADFAHMHFDFNFRKDQITLGD